MAATHKSTVYKTLDIPNPFQKGQDRAYADILQDKFKEAQTWRRLFFVNIGLFAIALILYFSSISQQQIVPVLVNVMPSGESQYLGEVRQGNVQIPEAAIHFEIRKFVTYMRTVSTDYQVVYNNIDDCFHMATSSFSQILRTIILNDSPFELVGKVRRTIDVESVLNITERSYQINWAETTIDVNASQRRARYRAVVTVRLINPTDNTIKRNPLGIYIENFEMTEL
jgi:type IV secretion system protein VirB5